MTWRPGHSAVFNPGSPKPCISAAWVSSDFVVHQAEAARICRAGLYIGPKKSYIVKPSSDSSCCFAPLRSASKDEEKAAQSVSAVSGYSDLH